MNDEDYIDFHEKEWDRLPQSLKLRGIAILKEVIPQNIQDDIRSMHKVDGSRWMTKSCAHFTCGMYVRNQLRKGGLTDALVPSGNLDDYYVQLIEAAVGVRPFELRR